MAWTYNDATNPGVLTSTGATEASPDSLLAGIAIVQAANPARGYRNGLLAWLENVQVNADLSFIRIDADCQIDLRGSSFIDPNRGGVMHDWRSTLIISTNTNRIDNALNFDTGSTFIARRQRPNDPSPKIVYNTGARHDYPNIQAGNNPAKVIIDGLDLYGVQGAGLNLKVYFGRAAINSVANLRFFNQAQGQFFTSTYNDGYAENLGLSSEGGANNVVFNRHTYYIPNPGNFGGALRGCSATLNNPTFLNNCWNGAVNFTDRATFSKLTLQYSYVNQFRSGLDPVEGVTVSFVRARQAVTGAAAWTAPNAVITATSDAQGVYTPVNLIDAYREGAVQFDIERFNWTAKARSYARRTAGENLFTNRVLYQHSVNMSAGYSEEVQMLDVQHLTLTEAQAAALTGITLTPSGETGGTVTISGTVTASDLWHYYRAWISLTANFDSNDTWGFDGATLNIGAWNVVVSAGATLTANFVTTGAVSGDGEIVGSYTDASGTRVTIRTADDLPLSTYLTIDGVPQAWVVASARRRIFVQPNSVVRVYAHAYGYQPRIINITGDTASDYVISLLPENNVNTVQDTTVRDTVAGAFAVGADAFSRLFLSVNADLRQYSPAQVLNALHYFTVTQGAMIAAAAVQANSVDGFALQRGGFVIRSPGFYGKVADSITSSGPLGILVPLAIAVDPSVYLAVPSYTPVEVNTSGVVLQYAPWTQQEADVPSWVAQQASVLARPTLAQIEASTVLAKEATLLQTEADIIAAIGSGGGSGGGGGGVTLAEIEASTVLAKEATVASRASQASVDALGTPAQASALTALATASQTEHDATQAAIAALPAPLTNAETQAAASAALVAYDGVVPADLAGLATEAQVVAAQAAIIAEVDAIPTNPILATDARLGNLDAAVSSRLATADYTAPDNAGIAALPTLAEMEASVALTAVADVSGLATAAQVGTPLQAGDYTAPANADIAAIKTKADTLVNGPTLAQIEGSSLAKEASVTALGSPAQAADLVPVLRAIDGTPQAVRASIKPDLNTINANLKPTSLGYPHTTDLEP